ncbi:MAG TPA: hypothetical protein VFU05_03130 [Cyclobacteriaceae bacterium]|nr:hypothetical protein [Cyclobacteriaceae bacterium]
MRNTFLLLSFLFVGCVGAIAQNKTLGVGVATPNTNAALHVESPTNNQGFIMPRLTSTQRLAMTLTPSDMGLMVYDITETSVFTWDGTAWSEAGDIAYPIADTISTLPPNGAALAIMYAGSDVGNFGVANFQNQNPNNGYSALFVNTNSNTNGASDMLISNPNNNNDVIGASTNGKGTAGRFTVNNTNNRFAAIYATTNGQMGLADSSAAVLGVTSTAFSAVTGKATGPNGSNGVTGLSNSSSAFSFAVYGNNTGGGVGGMFQIGNAGNTSNALEASTIGTGGAAKFKVTNAASTTTALWSETNSNQPLSAAVYGLNTGTGDAAGVFRINNASSIREALFAETNGSGATVRGLNTGTGNGAYFRKNGANSGSSAVWGDNFGNDGYAGIFQNISATNPTAALFAESVGPGASIWANKDTGESGPALDVTHQGTTGAAGLFTNMNAANTSPALSVSSGSPAAALFSQNTGSGNGFAALFQNTNASNTFPPVQIATNSNTANAMYVNHTGSAGNFVTYANNDVPAVRIGKDGVGYFNGGTQNSGADVAEMFDVEGIRNEYEPGDVLIISESTDRTVEKSNSPNSTKVAGVYATKPGVLLTEKSIEDKLDALVPMGVVGVIPTKVCLENGPIKRGDLLVTSSMKGHAMKAVSKNGDGMFPAGVIIGKALENFESGSSGLIKVLVNVK